MEKTSARMAGVQQQMKALIRAYGLEKRKVLEVGSGTGTLQDLVPDYTGLDLASSVQRYYHKPFVAASATAMPFADNSFDAIWSIWVVEHIPEPERALMEMRRVLKPGGILLLAPAWFCTAWSGEGYEVRPYSDFDIGGKFIKASVPIRKSMPFLFLSILPVRVVRFAQHKLDGGPTRLRFRALQPNYEKFWVPDSDAAVSLDSYEAMLWFRSRGDECLNCGSDLGELNEVRKDLVLRIRKPDVGRRL
ncbi:MAG: class I SAM-dependent methyltransferase [Acidobacteriia bacterium]|nr:class I SAM-dependent methyltransferase [Terriglobia bacterium]